MLRFEHTVGSRGQLDADREDTQVEDAKARRTKITLVAVKVFNLIDESTVSVIKHLFVRAR